MENKLKWIYAFVLIHVILFIGKLLQKVLQNETGLPLSSCGLPLSYLSDFKS